VTPGPRRTEVKDEVLLEREPLPARVDDVDSAKKQRHVLEIQVGALTELVGLQTFASP
jgi:hypothetical protein